MIRKVIGWTVFIIIAFLIVRAVAANPAGAAQTVRNIWNSIWTFLVNL